MENTKEKKNNFPQSTSTLIGIIQWALVLRQVMKEGRTDAIELLQNPLQTYDVAIQYGFTYAAIERELVRIGRELEQHEIA